MIGVGDRHVEETVAVHIAKDWPIADILRADGDAAYAVEGGRRTVIEIDHVRRVEAGNGEIWMTVRVHVHQHRSAPADTCHRRARGRRDKHALHVLERIRGAVVQVNGRWAAIDAEHDVGRTITIEIADEAAHRGIDEVRRDALKGSKLDPGANDQRVGRRAAGGRCAEDRHAKSSEATNCRCRSLAG